MPEFAPVFAVSTLNGNNGFRLDGDLAGYEIGRAVSGGGDINGDGFADLLIGAPVADAAGIDLGFAYVVFGSAASPAAQSLNARLTAGTAYVFLGEAALGQAGYSIANAGDVNGDGFDDLIIGARYADPDVAAGNRGASYLVFGGLAKLEALDAADGINDNVVSLVNLTPATGYRFDGVANDDQSGWSVSGAGDANGDGFADLVIGAPFADPNSGVANGNEGASTIIFGGANLADLDDDDGSADARIDLAQVSAGQGLRLDGVTTIVGDFSGLSVALVGDVNGDGFADVLIGAPNADPNSGAGNGNEGAAYLIFGRPQALFTTDSLDLANLSGLEGTRFDGAAAGDNAGESVNGLGDINGDGLADIVIGAPFADPSGNDSGSAYVVFGKTGFGASRDLATLTGTDGFRLDGIRAYDRSGFSVSAARDVNGDGFGDILIGADGFDRPGAFNAGAAYVVFGRASGFAPVIDLGSLDGDTGFRIEGAAASDFLGFAVAAAGDVNGDGFADIAVGAYGANNNSLTNSGSTYIIYGHRAEFGVTRLGTDLANRVNGGKGDDVITGLGGNDTLFGWESDDLINGSEGNDVIDGGAGEDTINGGGGADTMTGGDDADHFNGGSGGDTVSYLSSLARIKLALDGSFAAEGDAAADSFASVERITGTGFGDVIRGNHQDNRLIGGNGNDTLQGMAGNDTILAGQGSDALIGGLGDDGFDYTSTSHGGDTINDFHNLAGDNDALRFSGAAFGGLPTGTLAANRFLANTTGLATNTTQRFIYETDTGTLRYDSNGTGAGGITIMATLTGLPALSAVDIVII